MTLLDLRTRYRDAILRLAAQHGARHARVFGSVARGEARPDSDVDFLVEFELRRSLLDCVGLWQDLEELLGHSVDLVEDGGVSKFITARVLWRGDPVMINDAVFLAAIAFQSPDRKGGVRAATEAQ